MLSVLMPAERSKTVRHRDQRANDPNYNLLLQDTLARIDSGELKSFKQAAETTGEGYIKLRELIFMAGQSTK